MRMGFQSVTNRKAGQRVWALLFPSRAHAAIVADYQEGMQRAGSLPMLMQQFFCFVCRSLEEYMEHSEIAEECR